MLARRMPGGLLMELAVLIVAMDGAATKVMLEETS
jgi:hypothetical protein